MFTTTAITTPILPASIGVSSVGKHDCRLSSMEKTKRRLNDATEASVRPMYVSVSFLCLLSFPLSFFCVCCCMYIGFPFLFLVFLFLSWIAFPLFCPLFSYFFLLRHLRMSCVLLFFFVFLFVRHYFHLRRC
jgi:hypothetical protein